MQNESATSEDLILRKKALKLGIVGGLGARAGADILNRIVQLTPVKSERDHREISFEQKPLVEEIGVTDQNYVPAHRKFYVFDTLLQMEKRGCEVALLPCFITHTFIDELRAELNIKIIMMTEAIENFLSSHHANSKHIGVLTTPYVRSKKLFEGIVGPDTKISYPDEQEQNNLLNAVYGSKGFKAGHHSKSVLNALNLAIENLISKGVEIIIPGMTEIPLLLSMLDRKYPATILNTNQVYAQFALNQTSKELPRPFKVGVVGGVGPAATVDFMSKIVDATDANSDQEHIKLLVEHNPQIPDRTLNLVGDGPDPTIALYATCKKLERGGADVIAIPCNTAHAFTNSIQRHLDIAIVSILDETIAHIQNKHPNLKRIGILATTGTISSNLYQDGLKVMGLEPICPNSESQRIVMDAIYGEKGVKAGYIKGLCKDQITKVISSLKQYGAQGIILGCTELPLIAHNKDYENGPILFDPTQILAQKCVHLSQVFDKRH